MSKLRAGMTPQAFDERSRETFPGLLGLKVTAVEEGRCAMRADIRRDMLAPNGFLHAAVVVALADTAAGFGSISHLPEGASGFTTIELKANFLGTARGGAIACVATAAHLGRSTHVWDAEVTNEASGQRIALFRCTQIILWPK